MSRPSPVDALVPGDKSITHRALLFAAVADGRSQLTGLLNAADTRSTASALRALGVPVPDGPLHHAQISGAGLRGLREPAGVIDCGNSGTTARLLLGLLAGSGVTAVLDGDPSLRGRPMRRVTTPLSALGAVYEELGEPGRLPVRVRGTENLQPIELHNERSSAQVKSAMLLAALTGGTRVVVRETGRSRDHTERMLVAMGAPLQQSEQGGQRVVLMDPVKRLEPLEMRIPRDFSSAAFFLALGALVAPVRVRGVGLNPSRTGALDVLARLGARVEATVTGMEAGEPVGDVVVGPGPLESTVVTAAEVPTLLDEIPILAVVAALAAGKSRFEGVAELRVKESDRVQALVDNFRALDVPCDADADTLTVEGTDRPLDGVVDAFDDHRIAMAFAVLGAVPRNRIRVRGKESVGISFPGFFDELARVQTRLEAE